MFCKYFLPILACLLILLTVSFTEQQFYILIKSNLAIFSFMNCAFVLYLKTFCQIRLYRFYPLCSPYVKKKKKPCRSFIVFHLHLILFYVELIFMKGVQFVSTFTFLCVDIQLFKHHLWKKILSPLDFFHSYVVDQIPSCVGLI